MNKLRKVRIERETNDKKKKDVLRKARIKRITKK